MGSKLLLRESSIGLGVFSDSDLAPTEVCGYLSGAIVQFDDVVRSSDQGANAIQIGPGIYIDPLFPLRYVNHSCKPNVGLRDDLSLVAISFIGKGEEIRLDYSTTMYERYFTMMCCCGESNCRGVITDFDLLPESLKAAYLDLGVVQGFIKKRVCVGRSAGAVGGTLDSLLYDNLGHAGVDRVALGLYGSR